MKLFYLIAAITLVFAIGGYFSVPHSEENDNYPQVQYNTGKSNEKPQPTPKAIEAPAKVDVNKNSNSDSELISVVILTRHGDR